MDHEGNRTRDLDSIHTDMATVRSDMRHMRNEFNDVRKDIDKILHIFLEDGTNSIISRMAVTENRMDEMDARFEKQSEHQWTQKYSIGLAALGFIFSMLLIGFEIWVKGR